MASGRVRETMAHRSALDATVIGFIVSEAMQAEYHNNDAASTPPITVSAAAINTFLICSLGCNVIALPHLTVPGSLFAAAAAAAT